jgi:hypothetical protein
MASKYIALNAGVPTEVEGTVQSTGAADAGRIPALNAQGVFDETLLPPGIAADVALVEASENLSAGDFVNIYDASGAKCRKADASTAGKHAHGFVLDGVTSGNNATVYFEGTNNQVVDAAPGDVYLSATTPGSFTSTAPSGTGKVVQRLGVATSATSINFEAGQRYILA